MRDIIVYRHGSAVSSSSYRPVLHSRGAYDRRLTSCDVASRRRHRFRQEEEKGSRMPRILKSLRTSYNFFFFFPAAMEGKRKERKGSFQRNLCLCRIFLALFLLEEEEEEQETPAFSVQCCTHSHMHTTRLEWRWWWKWKPSKRVRKEKTKK